MYDVMLYALNTDMVAVEMDARAFQELTTHFKRHKLRSRVQVDAEVAKDWSVWQAWGIKDESALLSLRGNNHTIAAASDPRCSPMGMRVLVNNHQQRLPNALIYSLNFSEIAGGSSGRGRVRFASIHARCCRGH